jgi:hypothetical protein
VDDTDRNLTYNQHLHQYARHVHAAPNVPPDAFLCALLATWARLATCTHLALLGWVGRCRADEPRQGQVAVAVVVDALDGGRLTHELAAGVAACHGQEDALPAGGPQVGDPRDTGQGRGRGAKRESEMRVKRECETPGGGGGLPTSVVGQACRSMRGSHVQHVWGGCMAVPCA